MQRRVPSVSEKNGADGQREQSHAVQVVHTENLVPFCRAPAMPRRVARAEGAIPPSRGVAAATFNCARPIVTHALIPQLLTGTCS